MLESRIFRQHLENCIIYQKKSGRNFNAPREKEAVESGNQSRRKEDNPKKQERFVVKLQRAHGGYLGIQRR
jgi:regulatory protein YycI of two-component signal transduction system YycFG